MPTTRIPAILKKSRKAQAVLRNIESSISSISKERMSPASRRKLNELRRVHSDLKRTYVNYINTSLKTDVNKIIRRVKSSALSKKTRR